MASKFWSKGTLLQREDPDTLVWETIANCGDIAGPDILVDQLEVTNHSSPGDFKEFIPTLLDGQTVAAPIFYDPADATHIKLDSDLLAKRVGNWRLQLTDPAQSKVNFPAHIQRFGYGAAVNGALTRNLELKVDGAIS